MYLSSIKEGQEPPEVPEPYGELAGRLLHALNVGLPEGLTWLPLGLSVTPQERRRLQDQMQGGMPVLVYLVRHDGRATSAQLREATGFTNVRLSTVLSALEEKGLVERVRDDPDRRRVGAVLTELGRRLAEQRFAWGRALLADFLQDLGESDSRQLVALAERASRVAQERQRTGRALLVPHAAHHIDAVRSLSQSSAPAGEDAWEAADLPLA